MEGSPPTPKFEFDLFCSYAWGARDNATDKWPLQEKTRAIISFLSNEGYKCWVDEDRLTSTAAAASGGVDEAQALGILRSSAVVIFLSSEYALSANCRKEVQSAEKTKRPLIFVNVGDPGYEPGSFDWSNEKEVRDKVWLSNFVSNSIWADCRDDTARVARGLPSLMKAIESSPGIMRTGAVYKNPNSLIESGNSTLSPLAPMSLPSPSLHPILWSELTEQGRVLGVGSFGAVQEYTYCGIRIAVKELKSSAVGSEKLIKAFLREVAIQRRLHHPHVLRTFGQISDAPSPPPSPCESVSSASSSSNSCSNSNSSSNSCSSASGNTSPTRSSPTSCDSSSASYSSTPSPPSSFLSSTVIAAAAAAASSSSSSYSEFLPPTRVGIALQLMGPSVESLLGSLPFHKRLLFVCQLASGLVYLHGEGIVHGDIKLGNALTNALEDPRFIAISDFGLASAKEAMHQSSSHGSAKGAGTPAYKAPELFAEDEDGCCIYAPSKESDVYAFAITAFCILAKTAKPFPEVDPETKKTFQPHRKVPKGFRPHIYFDFPEDVPQATRDLLLAPLKECWHHSPEERPTMRDAYVAVAACLGDRVVAEVAAATPTTSMATLFKEDDPAATRKLKEALELAISERQVALEAAKSNKSALDISDEKHEKLKWLLEKAESALALAEAGWKDAEARCTTAIRAAEKATALEASRESTAASLEAAVAATSGSSSSSSASSSSSSSASGGESANVIPSQSLPCNAMSPSAIVQRMRAAPSSVAVIEAGLAALEDIARRSTADQDACAEAGAVSLIHALLIFHGTPLSLSQSACKALNNIAISAAGVEACISSGAVPLVAAILRANAASAPVCEWACRVLCNITVPPAGKEACVLSGIVPLIAATIKNHPTSAEVCQYACWALRNISNSVSGENACISSGAIPIICALLAQDAPIPECICECACLALVNIADSDAGQRACVASGAAQLLVRALETRQGSARICALACRALVGITRTISSESVGLEVNLCVGLIPSILHTLTTHAKSGGGGISESEDICAHACWAIANIAKAAAGQQACVTLGAVPLVAAALKEHAASEDVCCCSCLALLSLVGTDNAAGAAGAHSLAAQAACMDAGVIPLLISAAREGCLHSVDICSTICSILLIFGDSIPLHRAAIIAHGAKDILISIVKVHAPGLPSQIAAELLAKMGYTEKGIPIFSRTASERGAKGGGGGGGIKWWPVIQLTVFGTQLCSNIIACMIRQPIAYMYVYKQGFSTA